ncbi:MAG: hypothetical protein ACKOCM_07230 [Cyanobacteriota bacterium]
MGSTHLELMHATAQRLRLRYPREMPAETLVAVIEGLALQPWVRGLHHRVASASLVIELAPGFSPLRWQLGLAELDCALMDRRWAESAPDSSWERMARQIGGNIIGATLGQVVIGGSAGLLGAWLLGPRAGVILGACGALVGSVLGSVAGGELAAGESPLRQGDLGAVTLRKLGGRLGEEAGWSTGAVIGAALAGPAGALAGKTIGSIVAGQAVEDLIQSHGQAGGVGRLSWLVRLGQDQGGERATESLMGGLGRSLSGGQDWGARLGARLGASVGRKIDWAGSLSAHHLVNRIRPRPALPAT